MPSSTIINTQNSHSNSKERQFKGLSLAQRQQLRREKLIEAGIECYGTLGFFSVTVKDICQQAKLTERYFYESFKKSDDLFLTVFLKLIEKLQHNVMHAIVQASPDPDQMIDAGLTALLHTLQDDPRLARIIYMDATLVQELHNQATLQEAIIRFARMIQAFMAVTIPNAQLNETEMSFVASGLNGYVTHIALRWVSEQFKQPLPEVLNACRTVFTALLLQYHPPRRAVAAQSAT